MRRLFFWLMALMTFLSCSETSEEPSGANLKVGDEIPAFSVVMNDGKVVDKESLLGSVSLIVFFHTNCPDCQKELPVLQQFYEENEAVPLVCISRSEGASSVASYWKEHGLTLPYSAQEDRAVYEMFARTGIPRIYVVDASGVIRSVFTDHPLADLESLEDAVRMALAETP